MIRTGFKIVRLSKVNSTNEFLLKEIQSNKRPDEGLLVVGDEQTSGIGLDKTFWESEPGKNITMV